MRTMERMGSRLVVGFLMLGAIASCAEEDSGGMVEVIIAAQPGSTSYVAAVGAGGAETKMELMPEGGRWRGRVGERDLVRYFSSLYVSPSQGTFYRTITLRGAKEGDVISFSGEREPLPAGCICEEGEGEGNRAEIDARFFRSSGTGRSVWFFDDGTGAYPDIDVTSMLVISCPEQDFDDLREKLALYNCP